MEVANTTSKSNTGNLTFQNDNRSYVFNENYSNPNFLIEEGTGIFFRTQLV